MKAAGIGRGRIGYSGDQRLRLRCKEKDLSDWTAMVEMSKQIDHQVTIGLVGKYTELKDAYLSVVESLNHAAIFTHTDVNIRWIEAEAVTPETADKELKGLDGILIPGGFGVRGTEGKIETARYARENKIPYFGNLFGNADCNYRICTECGRITRSRKC